MTLDQILGRRVQLARRVKGVTVADMAAVMGVSETEYKAMESGTRRFGAKNTYRVSKHLGVDLKWLFEAPMDARLASIGLMQDKERTSDELSQLLSNVRSRAVLSELFEKMRSADAAANKISRAA